MSKHKLSRRDFLKVAGATSAGLALSACGAKATEVPSPTATLIPPTQTPASTSAPTSTPVPSITPIPDTLRGYADALGFKIGVVAETSGFDETLVAQAFNQIAVSSIGWEVIGKFAENSYTFTIPDQFIRKYAPENDLSVLAMHVVYGVDLPDWLRNGTFSRERLIEIMKNHVRKVMGRYRGQVRAYTVVNEASQPSIFWNQRVGPDYVEMAFQTARETDPDAILLLNDAGHELARLPLSNKVFTMVKALKEKDLVDAVGFQMHILGQPDSYLDPRTPPTKEELLQQFHLYDDIGVKVFITELDVDTGKLPGTWEEKLTKQAEIYATVVEACLESSGICNDINIWGLSDIDTWRGEAPYLFSVGNNPKPAYFAVLDVLKKFYNNRK